MKALHFGAGNIGRGFIGKLLYEAGAEVTFADVVPDLINELKARKKFGVRVVGGGETHVDEVIISGAVFSNKEDEVLPVIQSTDLLTTAVGPRILERIAPTIAKGLLNKMKSVDDAKRPLNIVACENAIRATSGLKGHVMKAIADLTADGEHKTEDVMAWVSSTVGFVDCAVDRIVPPSKDRDILSVTVESFSEWVVDLTQFVGPRPNLGAVVYTDNLNAFIERKLLTVNTGHAICAYYGKLNGHTEIRSAILDPNVRKVVEGAMRESGAVLVNRYAASNIGLTMEAQLNYIAKILSRFENEYIVDEISRVGRDPIRKLSHGDRLMKPLCDAVELGLEYDNLLIGVCAALLYRDSTDQQAVKLEELSERNGPIEALKIVSNVPESTLSKIEAKMNLFFQENETNKLHGQNIPHASLTIV